MKVDVVLSTEEERYICIGNDAAGEFRYALASDVARGPKYAERYSWTREEIERDDTSPLVAEFSVEIKEKQV